MHPPPGTEGDGGAVEEQPRRRPGRPRSAARGGSGGSTRDEILEAAATLFSAQGYDATSTRQIARAVGIRQASLYYHFADKGSILRSILNGTVAPSVTFAAWLGSTRAPATAQLCALALYDVDGLLRDRWNMHAVYVLTDVGEGERDDARADQAALRAHYRRLTSAVLEESLRGERSGTGVTLGDADLDLTFGLVEGVITHRQWGSEEERLPYAEAVVRGCLRLAHVEESAIPDVVRHGRSLVDRFTAEAG